MGAGDRRPLGRTVLTGVPRWLAVLLLGCVSVLVVGFTIDQVAEFLGRLIVVTAAVVSALLLTALLVPLTDALERVKVPRALAALLTILATLAAVIGVGYLLVTRAVQQFDDLGQALRAGGSKLRNLLEDSPVPVSQKQLDAFQQHVVEQAPGLLPTPATGAALAAEIVSSIALTLFLWFFLLNDGAAMWRWLLSWVPQSRAAGTDRVGHRSWEVVTSYVRGTVVIALADAIGIGIALVAVGNPLWMSLSMLVFLGAFVPIVGATVSGVVAVIVTFATVGVVQALVVLAAVLVVQQLEGNLLQPLVMGHALKLHPVTIVLAVTAGAILAGVLGALVAVPVVAIIYRAAGDLSSLPRRVPATPDP